MTNKAVEATDILRAVNERLTSMEQRLQRIEESTATSPKARIITPRADIDDPKWGNPKVWRDPDIWFKEKRPSMKGKQYSECPPDYLDELARFNDWLAVKYETEGKRDKNGKPVAWRSRVDAERARLWAARLREQGSPVNAAPTLPKMTDEGYPASFDDDADKDLF